MWLPFDFEDGFIHMGSKLHQVPIALVAALVINGCNLPNNFFFLTPYES